MPLTVYITSSQKYDTGITIAVKSCSSPSDFTENQLQLPEMLSHVWSRCFSFTETQNIKVLLVAKTFEKFCKKETEWIVFRKNW